MRRILKWVGIVLGGLIGLLVVVLVSLMIYGSATFKRALPNRPLYPITADTSEAGVARGEYLARTVIGCDGCHSPAPANGEPLPADAPLIGQFQNITFGPIQAVFATPNLTPDVDTGLGGWTDAEIARAIREGVDKDGVELVIMPSNTYHILSDGDVAAIVGYLRGQEPVHNQVPLFQLNAFGKVALALKLFGPSPLGEPITAPPAGPSADPVSQGGYLLRLAGCDFCHGANLAGGPIPFSEPGTMPAANLTPGGELAGWSEADFLVAIHTGVTPSGRVLDKAMPRDDWSQMTDEDLAALFAYLKSVPRATSK